MTAEHLRPKSLRLGVLEGDDIGHEIVPAAVRVAEAAAAQTGLAIAWTSVPIGDRKSVVSGKRVSGRVALGGRRIIYKKINYIEASITYYDSLHNCMNQYER